MMRMESDSWDPACEELDLQGGVACARPSEKKEDMTPSQM